MKFIARTANRHCEICGCVLQLLLWIVIIMFGLQIFAATGCGCSLFCYVLGKEWCPGGVLGDHGSSPLLFLKERCEHVSWSAVTAVCDVCWWWRECLYSVCWREELLLEIRNEHNQKNYRRGYCVRYDSNAKLISNEFMRAMVENERERERKERREYEWAKLDYNNRRYETSMIIITDGENKNNCWK